MMWKLVFLFFSFVQCNSYPIPLPQKNTDILFEAFHNVSNPESPQYGQYWTQTQINDLIAPEPDYVHNKINFFKSVGLDCHQIGGDALECNQLPLTPKNHFDTKLMAKSQPIDDGDGYVAREVLTTLYNITYGTIQEHSSVCAVEYQNLGGISNRDLNIQQTLNNQPIKNITKIVGNNQSPMMEAQLDVQMMSQIAQNVDIWMWGGEQWLYSFAVHFLARNSTPSVLSMSWGWSTRDQCAAGLGLCPGNMTSAEYVHRVNVEYVKMGLRGITVTVSSGDAGAPGRTNEACMAGTDAVNPAFPGSSPYVTSVSATYIVSKQSLDKNTWKSPLCLKYGCVNGTHELPCNFNVTSWTTGGGFAVYNETRPKWQNTAVKRYLRRKSKKPKHFPKNGRGYPDVAAVGHNCPTVMGGDLMGIDGTSCSSPIFASLISLLNDYQKTRGKPRLGFVNPVLYKMWEDNSMIFHDITKGNNWCTEEQCCNNTFGYESTVGWDPVTGLGTPNFGLMLEWLELNL